MPQNEFKFVMRSEYKIYISNDSTEGVNYLIHQKGICESQGTLDSSLASALVSVKSM